MTNDWWGLHDGDDVKAREKTRPKAVNMRKDVELRTCYITTRDGVKVGLVSVGSLSFVAFARCCLSIVVVAVVAAVDVVIAVLFLSLVIRIVHGSDDSN